MLSRSFAEGRREGERAVSRLRNKYIVFVSYFRLEAGTNTGYPTKYCRDGWWAQARGGFRCDPQAHASCLLFRRNKMVGVDGHGVRPKF